MLTPKKVAIPAAFGFALSFFISIIATHKVGWSLLRALIFGIIFGGLAFGIDFLYTKFLNSSEETDLTSDTTKKSANPSGSKIDLVVGEENLTDDGQSLSFAVEKNKRQLPTEDTMGLKDLPSTPKVTMESVGANMENIPTATTNSTVTKDNFKPVNLAASTSKENQEPQSQKEEKTQTPTNVQKTPSAEQNSAASKRAIAKQAEKSEIDELPDISGILPEMSGSSENKDIIEDSDFANSGENAASERLSVVDGSKAKDHDAATMAKAIQTFLSKD